MGEAMNRRTFLGGVLGAAILDLPEISQKSNLLLKAEVAPNFNDVGIGVSVKTYGAIGDGTTNDAPAIQRAIDSEPVVFFPPGNYVCKATLQLKSGRRLIGAHRSLSTITFQNMPFGIYANGLGSVRRDIEVAGLNLIGHRSTTFGMEIIEIRDTENFWLHDCILDTASQYSFGATRGINHGLRIERNWFKNTGTFALETVAYPGLDGYRSGKSLNVLFSNNSVEWDPNAAPPVGDGYYATKFNNCDGVTITGNSFIGLPPPSASPRPNNSAVHITDSNNVYVAGNTIKWCLFGVTICRGTQGAVPNNVSVVFNKIIAPYYGIHLGAGDRILIAANTIQSGALGNGVTDSAIRGLFGARNPLKYLKVEGNTSDARCLIENLVTYADIRQNKFKSILVKNPGGNVGVIIKENTFLD
jgi:pectate lyase-like protein/parallel beta helix pectate lyase-like protein